MGILSSIMSGASINKDWLELSSIKDLDKAEESSYKQPVVLFKHSVTCGVSSFAKSKIDDMVIDESFKFYYLDLLSHRDISNEIASRFGVIHQSPQIVIVRNGKAIFDTSHHAIEPSIIKNNI